MLPELKAEVQRFLCVILVGFDVGGKFTSGLFLKRFTNISSFFRANKLKATLNGGCSPPPPHHYPHFTAEKAEANREVE